jgi:transposase-like protein
VRGKPHSEEARAQAMAALLAGQGVSEVAREYKLDKSLVSRWKKAIPDDQLQQLATKKGNRVEELLFDYLTTVLGTLKKQAEFAGEREYVTKQPADALAVLHGVMADKGIRLLEAAERANAAAAAAARQLGEGSEA